MSRRWGFQQLEGQEANRKILRAEKNVKKRVDLPVTGTATSGAIVQLDRIAS
jgi:hypothetical protein